MRRAWRERGPATVLVMCSSGLAVGVALLNVVSLLRARDEARVRDVRQLVALRVGLDQLDVRLLTALPRIVNAPFDLHATMGLVRLAPRDQLFDLTRDPAERNNRAAEDAAARGRLRNEITTWLDTARVAARQARAANMSEEHKAALRALGYLAG